LLRSVRVRDLALIASAEVSFGPGLNLLTGETGSGKSLLVDALALTLGARASSDQVRHGAERALVESVFDLSALPAVRALMVEMGFEDEADLVLSREIGGRGGARLNGRPASPGQLRLLGRQLVDVHGQHEHQSLLDPDAQTTLLDAFGGGLSAREEVLQSHNRWKLAEARLADLRGSVARGGRDREFMQWQLAELQAAALQPGEDEVLAAERSVSRHAVRLIELAQAAREDVDGADGPARAVARLRAAAELDPRLAGLPERLDGLVAELDDLGGELRRYVDSIDADPARLEAVEDRLAKLESVKKRFGGSLAAAISERERLETVLLGGEDLEAAVASAERETARARGDLEGAASRLTACRTEAAARLTREVSAELGGLRLAGARFETSLEARPDITADGAEQAMMRFSANPGEPLGLLSRVASGGELARVMLAIKTVGAEADRIPTLIFDEVDAGIGGEAALQVGLRLKTLGGSRQVLVVTHLAQIACYGDHHLVVDKAPGGEGRNLVRVRELESSAERATELARMMGGVVTEKALARAHELLEEARS